MALQAPDHNFGKDEYVVDMTGHEAQYWQGTESGLLVEFEFQGAYTAGDGPLQIPHHRQHPGNWIHLH